jgi:rhodanese-related sulfurtransferase
MTIAGGDPSALRGGFRGWIGHGSASGDGLNRVGRRPERVMLLNGRRRGVRSSFWVALWRFIYGTIPRQTRNLTHCHRRGMLSGHPAHSREIFSVVDDHWLLATCPAKRGGNQIAGWSEQRSSKTRPVLCFCSHDRVSRRCAKAAAFAHVFLAVLEHGWRQFRRHVA